MGKKEYAGTLEVTLHNGKTSDISIYQQGPTIWINDIIIHTSNQSSFEGIIKEIGIVFQSPVKEWKWKTYTGHLKFTKRRG